MTQALSWAAAASGFTCFMTCCGAALVFIIGRKEDPNLQRAMLGFAAGVMIASSIWSLLTPAIESAQEMGLPGWLPAAVGSAGGVAFLLGIDTLLPHSSLTASPASHRASLLALAVTLHNLPEGMAVGLSFALAAHGNPDALPAAIALAVGIGIQNYPEGAAISLPLYQEGASRRQAFAVGAASGIVEPIAAILTVLVAGSARAILPWLLSFAAGSMLYVVVAELIPQASGSTEYKSHSGTLGVMTGFLVMMILDVALG